MAEKNQEQLYRPHLSIAVLCEKVLHEADNVLSLIRIIDRFNVSGPTAEMQPQVLHFSIVIVFKSGFMRGKAPLRIQPVSPSGKELPSMQFPLLFEGDADRGAALIAQMAFPVAEEGLYWFHVRLFDEEITRIALRVVYQQSTLTIGQAV